MSAPKHQLRLATDSDLCIAAFLYAVSLLKEWPAVLRVSQCESPDVVEMFKRLGYTVVIDETLTRYAWAVDGETRSVYSDGA